MNEREIAEIAAKLTEAQRRALLAFSETDREYPGHDAKAKELGVSGNVLRSLYGVQKLAPTELELGPILVVDEYTREGRFWLITKLGLAVRKHLQEQSNDK